MTVPATGLPGFAKGLTWRGHGTTSEAVWAFEYGKCRVCYLAPGHTIDVMLHPEFQKMQRNAVRWLLTE